MTPIAPMPFPDTAFALTLVLLLIAPLSIAGLALVNTGLGRSRSAAQSLLGSLLIASTAAIAFALAGSAFAAGNNADHVLHLAGKSWDLAGSGSFFAGGLAASPARGQLAFLFEIFAVAFACVLPWGSGADRLRLPAGVVVAVLISVVLFPIFAHWTWGGGWLAQLGASFGLGANFLDPGGAANIHALGGLCALVIVWVAGPRKGKFPREGLSTAMPGHNVVYVLIGSLIALVGWLAWNMAGALLWAGAAPLSLVVVAVNTFLCAAAGLVAAFSVTRIRFGKPDASLCANGWLAGLVASSASAAVVSPISALFIGVVAGTATPLLVELFELALSIDDPSGAITIHGFAGLWGLAAAGLFSPQHGQFLAQLIGISTLLGIVLPVAYGLFWLADRVLPFRVEPDGERIGMDLQELGGNAYPEFVVHRDESYR